MTFLPPAGEINQSVSYSFLIHDGSGSDASTGRKASVCFSAASCVVHILFCLLASDTYQQYCDDSTGIFLAKDDGKLLLLSRTFEWTFADFWALGAAWGDFQDR